MNITDQNIIPEIIMDQDGIKVFFINTDKFKTNSIHVFFHDNLQQDTVTLNALLPAILRRGTANWPGMKEISRYMEELFGSSFDCGIVKKGERQIIQLYMEMVNDNYSGEREGFGKALEFLREMIYNPLLENGSFRNDFISQEKDNLQKLIESRVNDKMSYAIERCYEEMCKEERFGIYEYGNVKDLANIDSDKLFKHYTKIVDENPVEVFITGNMDGEWVKEQMQNNFLQPRRNMTKLIAPDTHKDVSEIRKVTEKMNVSQGKLSLGFRTNIMPDSDEYFSLVVYNGILGGGTHSKLFQNVREKASLAYYVISRLDRFKGLMQVSGGIEIGNEQKTKDIVMKQMEEIKMGNISDYEYQSTINSLETGIRSLTDSQMNIVDYYLSQSVAGTNTSFDKFIEKVKAVKVKDIVNAAQKIKLDTIYFLGNNSVSGI